ncbi:MAG: tetratricopeptide repeat protein [Bacteroidales bacterium]|nr:tetratricopeptide repeat protein [Bacteroidales bacterium]
MSKWLLLIFSALFTQALCAQTLEEQAMKIDDLLQKKLYAQAAEQADSVSSNNNTRILFLKAEAYYYVGQWERAIQFYRLVNQDNSGQTDFNLALCFANVNRLDSVDYYLRSNVKSDYKVSSNQIEFNDDLKKFRNSPYWESFWKGDLYSADEKSLERAQYYAENKQLSLALDILDELIEKNKNNDRAYFYRAQYIIQLNKDYKYALGDLKTALKLKPNKFEYNFLMAQYQLETFKNKKAYEYFQKADKIEPYRNNVCYYLAQSAQRMGQYDLAISYVDRLLKADDRNIETLKLAGLIYYDAEKYQPSIEYLTNALYINSRRIDLLVARGKAYFDDGQYQRAGMDFNIAIDLDIQNGELWYYKGLAYFYQDKKDQACKYFKKASFLNYYKADEYLLKECSR